MVEKEPSVSQIINERVRSESKPWSRNDPYKLGLVVEGSGMGGVVNGGMATGLEARNIKPNIFDSIHTVSSGGFVGAWYLAGEAPLGTTIFYADINNRKFINTLRFFQGKPIVDIPFLINVMKNEKPLKWQKIVDCSTSLHVYVTSVEDLETVDISGFRSQEDLLDALHWSSRIPVLAGDPIKINENTHYTDGALSTTCIPLDQAVSEGCTHILVLLARPEGTTKLTRSAFEMFATLILLKKYPEIMREWNNSVRKYEDVLKRIKHFEETPTSNKPKVEAVRIPRCNKQISTIETRKRILLNGAREGYNAVSKKFSTLPKNPKAKILESY